jgi:peptidoglycan hydrolase-like protein with peptidoglycan-binding domain
MLYNPTPAAPPKHTFTVDLHLRDTGAEVTALQAMLAYDGEFNLAPTGTYGPITARAVLNFQIKYQLASIATLNELGGDVVGPATRAKLNALV